MTASLLAHRAVIRLSPTDAAENVRLFLQGLVTSDMMGALPVWAGLLTPQGKTMFDFLVWSDRDSADLLLDCESAQAADLVKRLSLYRLRWKIAIVRDDLLVHWGLQPAEGRSEDPRLRELGYRWLAPASDGGSACDADWLSHRLACGVSEGHAELADILWLETNAVDLNGVSFTKGCYVGQENTARMNWRQKINRRLVVVPLGQSDEKRRKHAYPELGLAVDHVRIEDITNPPGWMRLGAKSE